MRICPNCETQSEDARCPECDFPTVTEADFFKETDEPDLVGRVFEGRYRVESMIGSGAMGWVFKAEHTKMGSACALKVMRQSGANSVQLVKRFCSEAQTSSQLTQPHTVRVYDFGATEDGFLFLVMEFLTGHTLTDLISAEPEGLHPGRAAHVSRQLSFALQEAHEIGLVHRDLKPDNLFLIDVHGEPDFVKVLDFGIAKFVAEKGSGTSERLTEMGATLGTPRYMSPEQASAAENLDHRSDIYAVGVILYEMLAGRPPFDGDSSMTIMLAHVTQPPEPLPDSAGGHPIPPGLSDLIMQCLAKQPDDRPQSCQEIADRLAPFASSWTSRSESGTVTASAVRAKSPQSDATRMASPVSAPAGKRRGGIWLAALLLIAGGAAAAWFLYFGKPGPAAARDGERAALVVPPEEQGGAAVEGEGGATGDETPDPSERSDAEAEPGDDAGAEDAAAADEADGVTGEADGVAGEAGDAGPAAADAAAAKEDEPAAVAKKTSRRSGGGGSAPVKLTREHLNKVFKKNGSGFRRCAKKHLESSALGASTVSLKVGFTIKSSGAVDGVKVEPAKYAATALGKCLAGRAKRMKFPRHVDKSVSTAIPLNFSVVQ